MEILLKILDSHFTSEHLLNQKQKEDLCTIAISFHHKQYMFVQTGYNQSIHRNQSH